MAQHYSSEARRLQLAESEELSEHATQTLKVPRTLPKHPICPRYDVPMWLSKVRAKPKKTDYFFECKACNEKTSITDVDH